MARLLVIFLLAACAFAQNSLQPDYSDVSDITGARAAAAEKKTQCEVPHAKAGYKWADCLPETFKKVGETCTIQAIHGYKCNYPDGPIPCRDTGLFETEETGKIECRLVPYPPGGEGCAKYDMDGITQCNSVAGCKWDHMRQWCAVVCRQVMCGVEIHARDLQCQFNCPLHDAEECKPWQAGCTCVQQKPSGGGDAIADCESWCATTNTHQFIWLPHSSTGPFPDKTEAEQLTVAEALKVENSGGFDPVRMCRDACYQRGVCVSPIEPL